MKIDNLFVSNFRGIGEASLTNLGTIVVIAGQNGSGKSCLFDAIRLLKSIYGGYQANEWQQWMGEFQINLTNRSSDFVPMFNDATRQLSITCDFRLSEEERSFIRNNAIDLLREKIWRTILPEAYGWGAFRMAMFAAQFRDREPEVAERAQKELEPLMQELAAETVRGEFIIPPGGTPLIANSIALSVVFSSFRPLELWVIDYHGAQRHYGRENVQGINLSLETNEQQRSQTALYNYAAKYSNVKGEMAASYVKEMLAEQAGVPRASQSSLTNTLKELFTTFFPEKRFLGPQATQSGGLSFPVITQGGAQHDLDELSAGEKEILYGYLRIRNSAPRYSIILLDEPELHLNPRLIRGLPQFYKKNLGEALGNQIWLVTHSDALLREVVGNKNYNVFHMLPCGSVGKGEGQLKKLEVTADLDLALVDLVGDLAAYQPSGKVVIFEGGGDSDFDQRVTGMLFPELQERANLVSGSNKVRVRALHETLQRASSKGQLPFKFYSIVDGDGGEQRHIDSINMFAWDVYHIENYFLVPEIICKVLSALHLETQMTEQEIGEGLIECAKETLPQLVRQELIAFAEITLKRNLDYRADPNAADVAKVLFEAVERSVARLNDSFQRRLNEDAFRQLSSELEAKYVASIADGSWVATFRGRDVLNRFVHKFAPGVPYEIFRNLILSTMRDIGYRPDGMKVVVDKILAD